MCMRAAGRRSRSRRERYCRGLRPVVSAKVHRPGRRAPRRGMRDAPGRRVGRRRAGRAVGESSIMRRPFIAGSGGRGGMRGHVGRLGQRGDGDRRVGLPRRARPRSRRRLRPASASRAWWAARPRATASSAIRRTTSTSPSPAARPSAPRRRRARRPVRRQRRGHRGQRVRRRRVDPHLGLRQRPGAADRRRCHGRTGRRRLDRIVHAGTLDADDDLGARGRDGLVHRRQPRSRWPTAAC